ncbi:MAG TPA: DnaA/Hda family protein, partial [Gemmatimonadales bacterium]|jgi:chromosomal replication initiation ATPase DnaA
LVDVTRPDADTRLAILKRKAEERHADLAADVLETVAKAPSRNVRELLGLLNRVVAFQAVNETPLTVAQAAQLLQQQADQHAGQAPGGSTAPRPAAVASAPVAPAAPDEFQQFFSGIANTLSQQVDMWKAQLGSAILRWQGEGYKTTRLDQLMKGDSSGGSEQVVLDFEKTVEHLKALEAEMTVLVPDQAGDPVFHDPDRLAEAVKMVEAARDGGAPPPGPSAAWAFDGFQASESNRAALAAAQVVSEHPGARYNPLVLVGPAGLGKTHLLHAIGHALAAAPGALVACISAQDFLEELARAVESQRVDQWRSRYRRVSAFLLDDAQLLAGSENGQEELFNLFNVLSGKKSQMVFTLSVPPIEVSGLADRLVTRLEGGLVTTMMAPDRDLRAHVISRMLTERVGEQDEHLVAYLADRPAESVRAVMAAAQHVIAEAESRGVPVTAAFARELTEGATPKPRRRSSVGLRTSGIIVSPLGGLRSREKVVWAWPDITQRLLEDA